MLITLIFISTQSSSRLFALHLGRAARNESSKIPFFLLFLRAVVDSFHRRSSVGRIVSMACLLLGHILPCPMSEGREEGGLY